MISTFDDSEIGPVSDFPQLGYSGKEIVRAGDLLQDELIWNAENEPKIRHAFQVASEWRASHAYPMRKVRYQLVGLLKKQGVTGITAARLKRMPSIRKKLRTQPQKLNQIQDIAGCRIILPSIECVKKVITAIKLSNKHELYNENDYIYTPKRGGVSKSSLNDTIQSWG